MSYLKDKLGGKISSKTLKKSHDAKSKALHSKIEGKRKDARTHRDEKQLSGLAIFH